MAKKIRSEDLFQGDVFKETRESAEQTLKVVKSLQDEFKETGKAIEKALSSKKVSSGKDLKEFNEQMSQLNDNTKVLTKLEKEEIRLKERLTDLTKDQARENLKLKEEIKDANQALKRSVQLDKSKEGSIKKLRLELAANKKAYIGLSSAERDNANIGGQLLTKIQEQTTELKGLEEQIGITSRNVGNYKESVKEAFAEMGGFTGSITSAIDSSGVLGGIVEKLTNGIELLSRSTNQAANTQNKLDVATNRSAKSFKVFNTILKASIIGLIVTALASLVTVLTRTQAGLDKVSVAMESLSGLLEFAIGRLIKWWQGLASLGGGLLTLMKALGQAIKGNFDQAGESVDKAFEKFKEGGESIKDVFAGVGEELEKVFETAEKIAEMDKQRRLNAIDLKKRIAELNAESEKAEEIEGDNTRSFQERADAIERSAKAQKEASELSLQLLQDELNLLDARQGRKSELTITDLEERNDLLVQILEAEKDFNVKSLQLRRVANQLEQDLIDTNLTILIDGFDNQKTINERQIANELKTFQERRQILEDTIKLGEDSLKKQVEQLQKKAKSTIDINELIEMDDAIALKNKIRTFELSQILEEKLLEVVRERRIAIQDLADAEKDLNQKQIALEKKYVETLADLRTEAFEDEQKKAIESENLAFERQKEAIQREFETLKTQEEINALIEEAEKVHQEKLDDIVLNGIKQRGEKVLKETELQMLKEGKTQEQIQNELIKQRIDLLRQEIEKRKELGEETIDQDLELQRLLTNQEKEAQKKRAEILQAGSEFIAEIVNKNLEKRLEGIDAEIEASKEKEQQLIDAAQLGNELAAESIAVERKRQAELEAEREQAIKRQEQLALALAGINAYTSKVNSGDPDPVGSVLTDISLLLSGLKAFEKGGLIEGGEQIVRVNEKGEEFVVNAQATKKLGVDTLNEINKGNINALDKFKNGNDEKIAIEYALKSLQSEFKKAVKEIPRQHFHISEITGGILEVQKEGSKLIKKHHSKVKRLQ